jgi:hypothetical protein
MGVLAPVMNSFGNRNFMQPMGRLSMHSKCLDLFSYKFWVRGFCFGEPSKFQLFLVMGNQIGLVCMKKVGLVSHPQLINKKQKNKYPKFMTEVISPGQKW